MPKTPLIYTLGSHFLRQKWFPQLITDIYLGVLKKTKIHRKRAYEIFDKLLRESVLLKLDLEENIGFKYNDLDKIKSKKLLKKAFRINELFNHWMILIWINRIYIVYLIIR